MQELSRDPIIALYKELSKSTDQETTLPIYSETTLRLAFAQVLRKRLPTIDELKLYRMLLLLQYAEKYYDLQQLQHIMPCLAEDEVRRCFNERERVLQAWRDFLESALKPVLYKEAMFEILCEWKRRYEQLFDGVTQRQLQQKTFDIQIFLGGDFKFMNQWAKGFQCLFANPNFTKNLLVQQRKFTPKDLEIDNIFEDLKPKLNTYVYETVTKSLAGTAVKKNNEQKELQRRQYSAQRKRKRNVQRSQLRENAVQQGQPNKYVIKQALPGSSGLKLLSQDSDLQLEPVKIVQLSPVSSVAHIQAQRHVGATNLPEANAAVVTHHPSADEENITILQWVTSDSESEAGERTVDTHDDNDESDVADDNIDIDANDNADDDNIDTDRYENYVSDDDNIAADDHNVAGYDNFDTYKNYIDDVDNFNTDDDDDVFGDDGNNIDTVANNDCDKDEDDFACVEEHPPPAKKDPPKRGIIDHDTAMQYVSALQAFAVVHKHFEVIGLLDKIDSAFRKKPT